MAHTPPECAQVQQEGSLESAMMGVCATWKSEHYPLLHPLLTNHLQHTLVTPGKHQVSGVLHYCTYSSALYPIHIRICSPELGT